MHFIELLGKNHAPNLVRNVKQFQRIVADSPSCPINQKFIGIILCIYISHGQVVQIFRFSTHKYMYLPTVQIHFKEFSYMARVIILSWWF